MSNFANNSHLKQIACTIRFSNHQ